MERLTDIIARVEKLAFAREEERPAHLSYNPRLVKSSLPYPLLFLSLNHPSFLNTSRRRPFLK